MHRAVVLLFAFGFGSTLLTAQTASQNGPQVTVQKSSTAANGSTVRTTQTVDGKDAQALIQRLPTVDSCPVSLTARQSANAFSREVHGSEPPADGAPMIGHGGDMAIKDVAQKLHLLAIGMDAKRVVAATVTVHGYANRSRFMPVLSTGSDYDAAKTLSVRFSPTDSGNGDSADLAVPGLTAVGAIDLNSVTYADGSTWKVAGNRSCRAWIDGFMPVSGR